MQNIKLYEQPVLTDYHTYSRVWITEQDYFTIYKSNFRTWFWTNYQVVHLNRTILTMIGDNEPPADLIDRTLIAIAQSTQPKPKIIRDDGIVNLNYSGNNEVITTREYQQNYNRQTSNNNLRRGQFNPNL
jgi:hypothetical protein